jgi:uncharacterized oligopeptide transporter (OPT) family protein
MPRGVSEEPEVPDAKAVKAPKLEPGTGDPPPGAKEVQLLRGEITPKALIAGVLVAALMGATYPYMVLKLGFGPNVSVVAAFFGFVLLNLADLGGRKREYNRWQNNVVEAAGTSAAQTAFMCVLLGAFDILHANSPETFHLQLEPYKSFLWLTAAATLGVLLAVPLRRHFVVDEKLPYADGLAAAETITVLDPPREASPQVKRQALAAAKAVMFGLALSGLVMLIREDTKMMALITDLLGWDKPWEGIPEGLDTANGKLNDLVGWLFGNDILTISGVTLASMGVGMSYSLLSIGSGMIIGLRINVSMMLGVALAWIVAPILLVKYGVLPDHPGRRQVLFWVMWPATGMLVAGGLTALALRWRLLVETFRSLRTAKIGSTELPLSFVMTGVVASAIALCAIQKSLLDMPVWMTLLAIVLSLPLMLVGLRVLGETNWGPISALSNMMQGVFAVFAPGNVAANMVASGTTGTIATSSEMIIQDYKCADVIGTKPRVITLMQLLAVPIGAAAVSWMYPLLVDNYGIVDKVDAQGNLIKAAELTSPISNKWAGFAQILKDGVSALPTSAMYALLIFSVLGIAFTVLESKPKFRKWIPSPTGIGIGILVPFNVVFTMFLGGLIGSIWERKHKKSADVYLIPLASGLIAGEALVAVIASIILAARGG